MYIRSLTAALLSLATLSGAAAHTGTDFDTHFADSTLRIDYTIAGNASQSSVYLDMTSIDPSGWAGRRYNLEYMPLAGNGSVTVRSAADGTTLYHTTFSTLYSEWLSTPEAKVNRRAYQLVQLLPYPRHEVDIEVCLSGARRDTIASFIHHFDPADILVRRPSASQIPVPHRYIHRAGDSRDKIDVAILAEGYTAAQTDSFYRHAEEAVSSILSHEPFASKKDRFNFVAVACESIDSGVSIPRLGQWRDTAVRSHFSTFYSDRYLTTPAVKDIHDHLTGIPYEHIIILANTDEYGGGGIYNAYTLTTARHPMFRPVVVHEFGHSFGGLGDEYFYDNDVMTDTYPTDIEPWEPNVTTDSEHPKWHRLIKPGTPVPTPPEQAAQWPVGVYEGAAYSSHGVYRPADHCRMRDNVTPDFCPACQWSLANLRDFYTCPSSATSWIND